MEIFENTRALLAGWLAVVDSRCGNIKSGTEQIALTVRLILTPIQVVTDLEGGWQYLLANTIRLRVGTMSVFAVSSNDLVRLEK